MSGYDILVISIEYILRSEIARCNLVLILDFFFFFLGNTHAIFHSSYIDLHFSKCE